MGTNVRANTDRGRIPMELLWSSETIIQRGRNGYWKVVPPPTRLICVRGKNLKLQKGKKLLPFISRFTLQTAGRPQLGWLKSGAGSSCHVGAGFQAFGPSFIAFPGALPGSWIKSGRAGFSNISHVRCWHCRWRPGGATPRHRPPHL